MASSPAGVGPAEDPRPSSSTCSREVNVSDSPCLLGYCSQFAQVNLKQVSSVFYLNPYLRPTKEWDCRCVLIQGKDLEDPRRSEVLLCPRWAGVGVEVTVEVKFQMNVDS